MALVDPDIYLTRFRLQIIERLLLITALQSPVLSGQLTVSRSQSVLEGWLDSSVQEILSGIGEFFGEPAQTALYGDSLREHVDEMKAVVAKVALALKSEFPGRA